MESMVESNAEFWAATRQGVLGNVDWVLAVSFLTVATAQAGLVAYLRSLEVDPVAAEQRSAPSTPSSSLQPFPPSSRATKNGILVGFGRLREQTFPVRVSKTGRGRSAPRKTERSRRAASPGRTRHGAPGDVRRANLLRQVEKMGVLRVLSSMQSAEGKTRGLLKEGHTGDDYEQVFSGVVGDPVKNTYDSSSGLQAGVESSPEVHVVGVSPSLVAVKGPGGVDGDGAVPTTGTPRPLGPEGPAGCSPGRVRRRGLCCLVGCCRRSRSRARGLSGKVIIRVYVDGRGRVARSSFVSVSIPDPELVSCFEACIKRTRFSLTDHGQRIAIILRPEVSARQRLRPRPRSAPAAPR
jgi:hypothetical protein